MTSVEALLREWRERRRLTQLELALEAGISARHLSFVETGRSQPGREMLLRVLDQLRIPFREQTRLLLAAGHAPAVPERSLDDPDLAPVRAALDRILTAHQPNPAVVFDRAWNLVAANPAMRALTEGADIDPALLEPPVNVLRVGLHPRGLAPRIVNLGDWRAFPRTARAPERRESEVLGPLRVRAPEGGELSFLGMFATFDTPFEVTTSELAIEFLFPADRATAEALEKGAP